MENFAIVKLGNNRRRFSGSTLHKILMKVLNKGFDVENFTDFSGQTMAANFLIS